MTGVQTCALPIWFIFLYKECEHIYNSKGERIGHKLFVREFKRWQDAEKYDQTLKIENCEEYELIIDLDMFPCYDSKFCRYLHLYGRELQDYVIEHFPDIKDLDDVEELVKNYGIIPPDGFFKTKKVENKPKKENVSFDDLPEDESVQYEY